MFRATEERPTNLTSGGTITAGLLVLIHILLLTSKFDNFVVSGTTSVSYWWSLAEVVVAGDLDNASGGSGAGGVFMKLGISNICRNISNNRWTGGAAGRP